MKTCRKCKMEKELVEFHNHIRSKDGKQTICKKCRKEIDAERMSNPEIRKKTISSNLNYYRQQRQIVYNYMKTKQCSVCGEKDIRCLSFDHRNREDKSFTISKQLGRMAWATLLKEIQKCDILCLNCHAKRTAKQFDWYKDLET